MTPGAKMMMMRSKRSGSQSNSMTNNYGMENNMESRFRDRRGREHYDNGRYAPRNEWEAYIVGNNMENRGMESRNMENNYRTENREGSSSGRGGARSEAPRMNRIGFNTGTEMRSDYKTRIDAPVWNEGSNMKGGEMSKGHASSMAMLNDQTAHEWMENLKNADGTTGPHFSKEQVKGMMNQKSVNADPLELWVAMNMFYSDYCKVAKKLNVNNVNFYMDMACAFLDDEDAVDDKLAAYYECIVKHE